MEQMSDYNEEPMNEEELQRIAETEFEQPEIEVIADEADRQPQTVIKIGGTRIVADESQRDMSIDQLKATLRGMYPEVANSTHREKIENGVRAIEFLAVPGRKG
jgi:hypothetical protein